jgi:hypothetical protein
MEAIEFVINYEEYINEISNVIKPELIPIINELREKDPHDFVSPETYFISEYQAKGYVWALFMKQLGKHQTEHK